MSFPIKTSFFLLVVVIPPSHCPKFTPVLILASQFGNDLPFSQIRINRPGRGSRPKSFHIGKSFTHHSSLPFLASKTLALKPLGNTTQLNRQAINQQAKARTNLFGASCQVSPTSGHGLPPSCRWGPCFSYRPHNRPHPGRTSPDKERWEAKSLWIGGCRNSRFQAAR